MKHCVCCVRLLVRDVAVYSDDGVRVQLLCHPSEDGVPLPDAGQRPHVVLPRLLHGRDLHHRHHPRQAEDNVPGRRVLDSKRQTHQTELFRKGSVQSKYCLTNIGIAGLIQCATVTLYKKSINNE